MGGWIHTARTPADVSAAPAVFDTTTAEHEIDQGTDEDEDDFQNALTSIIM
jgi:hypothetical protein